MASPPRIFEERPIEPDYDVSELKGGGFPSPPLLPFTSSWSSITFVDPPNIDVMTPTLFSRPSGPPPMLTLEGSITQIAWNGLSISSPARVRLKTLLQLQEAFSKRVLLTSTIEGVFHEVRDMLDHDQTKELTLRALIRMTECQTKQLGLAIRHTFFLKIRDIGLSELTLHWLAALSEMGKYIDGFEKDMDFLIADWIEEAMGGMQSHPQAELLLQVTQKLYYFNAPFIAKSSTRRMVEAVCLRFTRTHYSCDQVAFESVRMLENVCRFGELHEDHLFPVLIAACAMTPTWRRDAFKLSRTILVSNMGKRALNFLFFIVENNTQLLDYRYRRRMKKILRLSGKNPSVQAARSLRRQLQLSNSASSGVGVSPRIVKILRGAIYCLANVNWSSKTADAMRCPPVIALNCFVRCMHVDMKVCQEVLLAVRRLTVKFGRDMQLRTTRAVCKIFHKALDLCYRNDGYRAGCAQHLQVLLDHFEELYKEGYWNASPEMLFAIVERCAEHRNNSSVTTLMEYRASLLNPHIPLWIDQMRRLLTKHLSDRRVKTIERREKAVALLHAFYTQYRMQHESQIVAKLMLPVLTDIEREEQPQIQYALLNVLFDVARNTGVFVIGDSSQLERVLALIRLIFNGNVAKWVTNENLEIVAVGIEEFLHERWQGLPPNALRSVLHILIEHIRKQYDEGFVTEIGSEVRERVIKVLLRIQCDIPTDRIVLFSPTASDEDAFLFNIYGIRTENKDSQWMTENGDEPAKDVHKSEYSIAEEAPKMSPVKPQLRRMATLSEENRLRQISGKDVPMNWREIALLIRYLLDKEESWPVIRACLLGLVRILEQIRWIKSAGCENLECLAAGLQRLPRRGIIEKSEGELYRYLPPVLALMMNYFQDRGFCRVLVDFVGQGSMEALMACDVLTLVRSDLMGGVARLLIENLAKLPPNAVRAIPVLEVLSDSADLDAFTAFFEWRHYRMVVEVLIAYTDVRRFNSFIIAAGHRILMRWYCSARGKFAHEMQLLIEKKIREVPALSASSSVSAAAAQETQGGSTVRQPSGDGRQIPGAVFTVGSVPDTPPPAEGVDDRPRRAVDDWEQVTDEVHRVLSSFFRLEGKLGMEGTSDGLSPKPLGNYIEVQVDHYSLGDSLLSIRTLVEKPALKEALYKGGTIPSRQWRKSIRDPETGEDADDCFDDTIPLPPVVRNPDRRRHHSSVQPPSTVKLHDPMRTPRPIGRPRGLENNDEFSKRLVGSPDDDELYIAASPPNLPLDDLFATAGPHKRSFRSSELRAVTWTELTVRHAYGYSRFLMRALESVPKDYEQHPCFGLRLDASKSLANCLGGLRGAKKIGCSEQEGGSKIDTRIRNLDRIPGYELHAVGVLYIGRGQKDEAAILANRFCSDRYYNFIQYLGRPILLDDCPGGLIEGVHGDFTLEYRDDIARLVFLIASLMPTNLEKDPNCNEKKKLIANNFITVVFNESGRPFRLGEVCGKFIHVALEVVPVDSASVRVCVHAKKEVSCWLAMRRAVLPDPAAAALVRKLAIRAQLSVQVWRSQHDGPQGAPPYLSSAVARLRSIDALKSL